jgi:Tol biopolymer transport system component/tRNA A-37 threonylcarbamoyl transferase component Bud32
MNGVPRIGQTLGHYRIEREIGAGGMGVVYEAADVTLGRRVALKFLPPELATDADRRARFKREARAIAALNHPNIVTLYSVEESHDLLYLTMELVHGKTLAELVPAHGMPLERFLAIAIPLADALAVAHQHGIAHRDLKPSNVMVSDDGRVKVLDFGIARAIAGEIVADRLDTVTHERLVVGTPAYMAPEQAEGKPIDARADIFSLGVVMFEMLTGQRPFEGGVFRPQTAPAGTPSPRDRRPDLPRQLARIVQRCVAIDPAARYQSALDLRHGLEEIKQDLESGELASAPRPAARVGHVRKSVLMSLLAAAILTSVLVAWLMMPSSEPRLALQNPHQVTFAVGAELQPAWSPDGGRIVYSAGGHIWVVQANGGAAINLTSSHAGSHSDPAWSPDGGQIAFVSQRDGVLVIPAIGGTPTRISSTLFARGPQWSPDGSEVACLGGGDGGSGIGNFIEIISLRTRESRQIRITGDAGNRFDLSWSLDGRFFAYVRAPNRTEGISRIWVLRASDQQQVPVTDGKWNDWSPTWSHDGRSLFYVSNRAGTMDLWQQRMSDAGVPEGDPRPVTAGVGVQQAAFSRDGRRVAYSQGRPVANLWRLPILTDREAVWDDAEQLTFDQALIQGVDVFPGGERLVFASDRGGNPDLWTMGIRGATIASLAPDPSADHAPSVSPDGARIAFYSYRSGSRDIWSVPAEGGPATQITRDPGSEMGPSWSPDGLSIAFWSDRAGGVSDVFVLPLNGGQPQRILEGPRYFPQWSPDGAWIGASSQGRFTRVPARGGKPEDLPFEVTQPYRWSRDGASVYFRRDGQLWSLAVPSGATRRLTNLSSRDGGFGELSFAAGLAHLYFTWRHDLGDIWVMDVATSDGK